jgi:single-stranded DNA-binding protein
MPTNNQVFLRGQALERPFFDMVPSGAPGSSRRIPFLRVRLNVLRDESQPAGRDRAGTDLIRVVAFGKLAMALQPKIESGDWLVVAGWIQVRHRPNNGGTVVEVVANRVDHFMGPLAPNGEALRRLEQFAHAQGQSPRSALEKLLLDLPEAADSVPVDGQLIDNVELDLAVFDTADVDVQP